VFLGREIGEQRNYSDDVARQIDEEVRAIIDRAYKRSMDVLTTYRDRLQQLAERLVAEETIEHDEFEAMFADLPDAQKDGPIAPRLFPAPQPPAAGQAGGAPQPVPAPQPA
jgi:cell division protease FtsH